MGGMDISFDAEETPHLSFPHSLAATAMDNNFQDYNLYGETNTLFQTQDLDDRELDPFFTPNYDTISSDGANLSSVVASKNIVSERNRRKKLNDRLLALRAVVPNITKMNKASIIKDAIKYIQELHEEEKKIQEEIRELESRRLIGRPSWYVLDDCPLPLVLSKSEKEKSGQILNSDAENSSPIEVLDLSVTNGREKTVVVKLRCRSRRRTIVKICQVFESLKLKVMTSTITNFSDTLVKTAFIEGEGEETESLKKKIEAAIEAHNNHPQTTTNGKL